MKIKQLFEQTRNTFRRAPSSPDKKSKDADYIDGPFAGAERGETVHQTDYDKLHKFKARPSRVEKVIVKEGEHEGRPYNTILVVKGKNEFEAKTKAEKEQDSTRNNFHRPAGIVYETADDGTITAYVLFQSYKGSIDGRITRAFKEAGKDLPQDPSE